MSRQLELFNKAKKKWNKEVQTSVKRDYNFDTLSGESLQPLYYPDKPSDNYLEKFEKKKSAKDFDKAAEDLRLAARNLGMIVGKVDVEELLGSIFNDFCIGK